MLLQSVVAMAAVRDSGYELVDHPQYSPDLAPSDYFLFPNEKKHFAGKQYRTNNENISAVEGFFEDIGERCKKLYENMQTWQGKILNKEKKSGSGQSNTTTVEPRYKEVGYNKTLL